MTIGSLTLITGILILTTNRVGTFDEAFKSRIQLSLHYQRLTEAQRVTIWENFFERLDTIDEESVNVDELRRNVRELAKYDMNGRQIRNALTTARQLALFEKETMDSRHLKHAIKVSAKFDQYLKNVKHGATDDDIAREEGVR
jgi:SpoVK/Ycf46/Vps4 family AAA+-type ATPase